ncbi:MAG: sigma 54-interacting transcriptional regulator [Polyangiaceae bacterium]
MSTRSTRTSASLLSAEDRFGPLLGTSDAMRRIFAVLPRIAQSETTILLEGETGTGKGVLASAIHDASARAERPFVVLDCTAIAPTLIESELFGHVKGAFTGAATDRAGAFEQAKGGTIFIDDGRAPARHAAQLLRALEEKTVKRVGGNQRIKLDARVIAATNRDLRAEVNRGTFRADSFYRLNVVRIQVLFASARVTSKARLARYFHAELVPDGALSDDLIATFRRQSWPGNVRELRAAVERAVLRRPRSPRPRPTPGADLRRPPADSPAFDPRPLPRQQAARGRSMEERYMRELISRAKGNLSEASRLAKMDRSYLRTLLRKYNLRTGDTASDPPGPNTD